MTKDQARNHYKELRARVMGAEAQGLKPNSDDLTILIFEPLLDDPKRFFVMFAIEIAESDSERRPIPRTVID